jgi:hypothetical protein
VEVWGTWRKSYAETLNNVCSWPNISRIPDSSVGIASRLWDGQPRSRGSIHLRVQEIFLLSIMSRLPLRHTQYPIQYVCEGSLPGVQSGRFVKLTTHLHLVPSSRMMGLYLHSPKMYSRHSASLQRSNFIYIYIYLFIYFFFFFCFLLDIVRMM